MTDAPNEPGDYSDDGEYVHLEGYYGFIYAGDPTSLKHIYITHRAPVLLPMLCGEPIDRAVHKPYPVFSTLPAGEVCSECARVYQAWQARAAQHNNPAR